MAAAKYTFTIVVDNVGQVHVGRNETVANSEFVAWVTSSKAGRGRAGNESVTLFRDGTPIREHDAKEYAKADKRNAIRQKIRKLEAAAGQQVAPTNRPEDDAGMPSSALTTRLPKAKIVCDFEALGNERLAIVTYTFTELCEMRAVQGSVAIDNKRFIMVSDNNGG